MADKTFIRIAASLFLTTAAFLAAQSPPPGVLGAAQAASNATRGAGAQAPAAAAGRGFYRGPNDQMVVDPVAAGRGRPVYIAECITCHGAKARGGDQGADLVRSVVVLHDRYGSDLGPFLKKGHQMQSGKSSVGLSQDQIQDLSHFLRQQLNDAMNRGPGDPPTNILTGDAKAGEAWFNGAGKCNTCHQPAGDLKGFGSKYAPVDIQQRFLFPGPGGRGGRSGPPSAANTRAAVTVTVTPPNGEAVTGIPDRIDDFNVTMWDASGNFHSWVRTPNLKIEKHDPLTGHRGLLEIIADKQMHDVVAYLETLK